MKNKASVMVGLMTVMNAARHAVNFPGDGGWPGFGQGAQRSETRSLCVGCAKREAM